MTVAESVVRLSWSQVSAYTQCPAKWWFSRRRPAEFVPSALKFGTAVHKAVAAFHTARMEGCSLTAEDLLGVYEAAWSEPETADIRYGKGEDERTLRDMAGRMLAAFLEGVEPAEVLAVEQGFAVEIAEGVLVSGFIDLVEVKEGRFWVVDAKTSRGEPSTAFDGEQLILYRLALQRIGLVPEGADVGLRYDVLRKLKTKGEFVSVVVETTDKQLDDLRLKVGQVARAVEAGIVYRNRSWACAGCPWANACAEAVLGEEAPTP